MAFRWGLREVGWTVQGPGYFQPPLVPATLTTMEKWDGEQFQTVTLNGIRHSAMSSNRGYITSWPTSAAKMRPRLQ